MNNLPIVVKNTLPAEIAVLSPEIMAEVAGLIEQSNSLVVNNIETMETANEVFKKIDGLAKSISSNRLEITRPIDALKKAIIAAEEQATEPLLNAKKDLGAKIISCQKELQRIREEEERKARAEAEAKAKAERERLEAERQAIIKKQNEDRAKAEAEAKEQAALFGEDQVELPPVVEPPPVIVVPVVADPIFSAPSIPKSAARTTTRQKLVIFDETLIPLCHAGVILRVPDEKVIEKLLKAGVNVPGCRLESVETVGSAGGRR